MTIIAEYGDYHVEYHVFSFLGVGAASQSDGNVNLDRPGRLMSMSAAYYGSAESNVFGTCYIGPGVIEALFGRVIPNIRVLIRNGAVVQDVSCYVTVWIRD